MSVSRSALELTEVRCSCPTGNSGHAVLNYGRRCGLLKANGEDVARILIREGLAHPYACGSLGCPTTSPAGRAAVLLNYALRPTGFIGHCHVRSSLNVGGEFRTSKKTPPVPENFRPSNADCPSGSCSDLPDEPQPPWQRRTSVWRKATILHRGEGRLRRRFANERRTAVSSDLPISGGPGMNPSHHGRDEQVFGAKQQVLGTGPSD
jgi:hypothetical protein